MGFSKRELKGLELAIKGHVKPVENSSFSVKSERSGVEYTVYWDKKTWTCTCQDYVQHKKKCKHIYAVIYHLLLREIVVGMRSECEEATCPHCMQSDQVIRRGFAYEKHGKVQRYYCKRCRKRFNFRRGLEGARGEAMAIVLALDLWFRGLSLRQVSQHLASVYGIRVSHTAIHGWIKRYVKLVSKAFETLKLEAGLRWHCDETKLKVQGRHIILWSVLDSETKILLAQHISEKRDSAEAHTVLKKALQKASTVPCEVVTDGCSAYPEAIQSALPSDVLHIQGPVNAPLNNNKIERYYRNLKQRFKSIYNFNSKEGAETFAEGYSIFYNFLRAHDALKKSPAEASGLQVGSCWQDLLKSLTRRARFKQIP